MADLPESATYPAGIYQLEQTDPVVGGPPNLATGEGMSNVQAQQLADRTKWLKTELESRTAPAAILAGLKTVDGAGSGLDADLLDGYAPSTSADANTIARRDFQRDIHARLLRSDYANQSTIPNGATIAMRIDATTDNYVRLVTAAGFVAWLNANNSGLNADTVDGLHSSSFLRKDVNDVTSGALTINGGGLYVDAANSSGNAFFYLRDETDKARALLFWNRLTDEIELRRYAPDGATLSGRIEIDSGGVVKINGSTAWHAGNDGSGSGLDADLLDGKNSGDFVSYDNGVASGLSLGKYIYLRDYDDGFGANTGIRSYVRDGAWYLQKNTSETNALRLFVDGNIVWNAGNHGSGSGLDADKLDGQHLSYFQQDLENRNAIELARGLSGDRGAYLDMHASDAVDYSARLIRYGGTDGNMQLVQSGAGVITINGGSDLQRNGYTVWHAGNDGAGSGLDADRFDGLDSWQFLRSDVSDGMNGSLTAFATIVPHNPGNAAGQSFRDGLTYRAGDTAIGHPENYFTSLSVKDSLHRHFQIGANKNSQKMYFRSVEDPTLLGGWGAWQEIWHAGRAAASLASSGYQMLPSGLILQWRAGANGHNSLLTFPIAFPNACFGVAFGDVNGPDTTANADVLSYANLTKTGFTFRPYNNNGAPSSGGTDYFFIALGY
ncbi:gp53-like domain-containing protein [Limimaricola sp. AA108-03]|uniref:gp53-like domain-containing protein n=1 Tax=Limimaricola sp. AA108-03 TaxID=3425945 RepID=UPI003D76AD5C